MTRINNTILIQAVDQQLVVLDESRGSEIVIPADHVRSFYEGVTYMSRLSNGGDWGIDGTFGVESTTDGRLIISDYKHLEEIEIPTMYVDLFVAAVEHLVMTSVGGC